MKSGFFNDNFIKLFVRKLSYLSIVSFLVRIITFFKEIVVASYFGTSQDLDAYLIVFYIPVLLVGLIAYSISSVMIPIYEKKIIKESQENADKYFSNLQNQLMIFLLIVTLLIIFFFKNIIPFLSQNNDVVFNTKIYRLFLFISPLIILNSLAILWQHYLNLKNKFNIPVLLSGFIPLFILLSIVAFSKKIGVYSIILGSLSGTIIQLIFYFYFMKKNGFKHKWILNKTNFFSKMYRQFYYLIIGSLFANVIPIINNSYTTALGEGKVSILNYAMKFPQLIIEIFTVTLSTLLLPLFSKNVASKKVLELKNNYLSVMLFVGVTSIFIFTIVNIFSYELVKICFYHGKFNLKNIQLVSETMKGYSFQIIFLSLGMINVRLLTSFQKNQFIMITAIGNFFVNYLLMRFFVKKYGVISIGYCLSGVYLYSFTLTFIFCIYILKRMEKKASV